MAIEFKFAGGRLIMRDHGVKTVQVTVKAADNDDILANIVVSREEWQRIAKAI
jgi:hypothetical protein